MGISLVIMIITRETGTAIHAVPGYGVPIYVPNGDGISGFGMSDYVVPVVVTPGKRKPKRLEDKTQKTFEEINREFGEVIIKYNEGDKSYRREHRQEYKSARIGLVNANKRFIVSMAKKHWHPKIDRRELMHIAKIAAYKASKNFDYRKSSFPNHSEKRIYADISRRKAQDKRWAVGIPYDIISAENTITKAEFHLRGIYGTYPGNEIMVDYLKKHNFKKLSKSKIKRLVLGQKKLRQQMYLDDFSTPSSRDKSPPQNAIENEQLALVIDSFVHLSKEQRDVMTHYLGSNGIEPTQNLSEIARRLNMTPEMAGHHFRKGIKMIKSIVLKEKKEGNTD
jgi:RNA polymerase sigma factor (sigma-70 family)